MSASYPSAVPILTNPAGNDNTNSITVPHATQHANANDEIEAICTELGTNPRGTSADVKTRLDDLTTLATHVNKALLETYTQTNADLTDAVNKKHAASLASHTGTTAIANGGTGATTAQGAINGILSTSEQGDIIYYNGTNWVHLPHGTSGQYLKTGGHGANPSWDTVTTFSTGMIILWSGAASAKPDGWYICDGTNGTPDLRGRFVIGSGTDSGGTYDIGDTGDGSIPAHNHSATGITDSGHTHSLERISGWASGSYTQNIVDVLPKTPQNSKDSPPSYSGLSDVTNGTRAASGTATLTGSTANTGTGTTNVAVYYALAYIMKA
jgi:hypothetical protein